MYRIINKNGNYIKDILALRDEKIKEQKLLVKVMENGKITYKMPSLEEIRKTTKENLSKLPNKYKKLKNAAKYKVEISSELRKLTLELNRRLKEKV
jgi:nicotinate phosphoribosyltransferase